MVRIEQRGEALGSRDVLARVIDIFRVWDDDASGEIDACGEIAPRTGRAPSARACGARKNTNFTDRVMNLQATVIGNILFEFIVENFFPRGVFPSPHISSRAPLTIWN